MDNDRFELYEGPDFEHLTLSGTAPDAFSAWDLHACLKQYACARVIDSFTRDVVFESTPPASPPLATLPGAHRLANTSPGLPLPVLQIARVFGTSRSLPWT
jgi:hypothetical protein